MPYAQPGGPFTATFNLGIVGLTGTAGVTIKDALDTTVTARTTVGIVELEDTSGDGTGIYAVTGTAPLAIGTYPLLVDTGGPAPEEVGDDLVVTGNRVAVLAGDDGWIPSVDEVAAILRGRTADSNGQTGTFTTDTRPTAAQASQVIIDAVDEVTAAVPWPLPDAPGDDPDVWRRVWRRIVALLAAMNIELAYPSANGGTSRYDRLEKRQDAALKRLIEAVAESGAGGGGESVENAPGMPLSRFDTCDLVGPRTVY